MLGHPVAHSLSPALHRAAYDALGLHGWTYEAVDVDEPDLPAFLAGLGAEWAGLSLTMPLKRAVRPLLARGSALAAQVGAVNTVTFGPQGPVGDNTDVEGIIAALGESGVRAVRDAVVLGGGATAASALAALAALGCRAPTVRLRSAARAQDLLAAAERLGVTPRLRPLDPDLGAWWSPDPEDGEPGDGDPGDPDPGGADVVLSTLPAGAADAMRPPEEGSPVLPVLPVLLDVVYAPWPTVLAQAWERAGGTVVGGYPMLLHQAAAQVRLMTGLQAPVEAMRAAGEAELRRREAELRVRDGATPSG